MGNLYMNYDFSMSRCQTICAGKKRKRQCQFLFRQESADNDAAAAKVFLFGPHHFRITTSRIVWR